MYAIRSYYEVLGFADIVIDVVYFAAHPRFGHGIADTALKMFPAFFNNSNNRLKVAVVVQGIKGPKNVHSVFRGSLHKSLGKIVGIIRITSYNVCYTKLLRDAVSAGA